MAGGLVLRVAVSYLPPMAGYPMRLARNELPEFGHDAA